MGAPDDPTEVASRALLHGDEPLPHPAIGRTLLAWLPGLALLTALVFAVASRGHEGARLLELARHAAPGWLALALVLQVATYAAAGEAWRAPLATVGDAPGIGRFWRLALLKLTADQVIPSSGISGTLLVLQHLAHAGVQRALLGALVVVEVVTWYLAYGLAVFVALALYQRSPEHEPMVSLVAACFAAAVIAAPLAAVARARRRGWQLPPGSVGGRRLRAMLGELAEVSPALLGNRAVMLHVTVAYLGVFVLDGLTLAATMAAVGLGFDLGLAFPAVVLAMVVSSLAVLPGGLGPFEGTAVGVLALAGHDLDAALAAVLLFRGLAFWLPMVPGFLVWLADRRGPSPGQ